MADSLPQEPGLEKFKLYHRDPKRKPKKFQVLPLGSKQEETLALVATDFVAAMIGGRLAFLGLLVVSLAMPFLASAAPRKQPMKCKSKKLGSAMALSQKDWDHWTQFVLQNHSPRLYCLLMLTCMCALRCSEACMLRAEDFFLTGDTPKLRIPPEVGRAKSPGEVPLLPEQVTLIRQWMLTGVSAVMVRKVNQHCKKEVTGTYKIPDKGRLFSNRSTYKGKRLQYDHLSYHAVWAAVKRLAKKFLDSRPDISGNWKQLRTHSGRMTKLTLMQGEGISLAVSMKYARHSKNSVATHLKYGKLTCDQIHKNLMEHRSKILSQQGGEAQQQEPIVPLKRIRHKQPAKRSSSGD